MSRRRARAGAVILLAFALALPAPAAASPDLEVGMEDERLLLSEPVNAPVVVREWAEAGVDVVRIHARWGAIAPAPQARRKPASLDAGNHHDSAYDWETLDDAVDLVLAQGMRVMLTVTGPGPLWTSREPRLGNPRWRPDPREYALFSRAVATRYRDKVDRYLIWNEPNIHGWLEPQSTCVKRVCVPASPHVYRGLVRAAKPVIERGDPGAQVLIGNLAPIGRRPISIRTPVAPLPFLRELGCVDAGYRPVRGGRCANFRPASGDAIGYHPHGVQNGPENPNPDRDQAQIGDIGRLVTVLDRLTSRGRIKAPGNRFDLYLTEFGYQTSPPDRLIGVSLSRQARYLQQAAYLAWRHPRIRNLTQYQWRDEPIDAHRRGSSGAAYAGWQSGLRFANGRPKPVMTAFRSPFVIDVPADRTLARLWGQVRPAFQATDVTVLELADGDDTWAPVGVARTDLRGYWTLPLRVDRFAKYRFEWRVGDGERRLSGVVDLALNRAKRWHASSP